MRVLILLILFLSAQAYAQKDSLVLFSHTELEGSSDPVSIVQFASDWQGNFAGGNFAFLDGRIDNGMRYRQSALAYEKRWYAGVKFNEDSARFYYNTQNDIKTQQSYPLHIRVKMLEAEGLNVSHLFQLGAFEIEPRVHWYQTWAYQLGSVQGNVTDQNGLSASAEVDYYYHQDQILDDPNTGDMGYGGALDLRLSYSWRDWRVDVHARDLWNYWYFPSAGHTYGCLNFKGKQPVCDSNTENYSIPETRSMVLPGTVVLRLRYQPYLLELNAYQHSRFERYGLQKNWSTPAGLLGVSWQSTEQLGLHWRSHWSELSLMSDHWQAEKAHNFSVKLALSWAF